MLASNLAFIFSALAAWRGLCVHASVRRVEDVAGSVTGITRLDADGEEQCQPGSHLHLLQMHAVGVSSGLGSDSRLSFAKGIDELGGSGLKAEFFYLHSKGVSTVDDCPFDDHLPDVTRTDAEINYDSTRELWDGLTEKERFCAQWQGKLHIKTPGEYTLYLESDDGSKLFLDGEDTTIDNDGYHPMKTKSVTLQLLAGDHPLKIQFFEASGRAGINFKYAGPDTSGNTDLVPSSALKPKPLPPPIVGPTGGLEAAFYYIDFGPSRLDQIDFDVLVPDVTRIDATVAYPSTAEPWAGLTVIDRFAARWTGELVIQTAGTYTFYLKSDDGSMLHIDGEDVLDNDGLHEMQQRKAEVTLTAGVHDIVLEYFENSGLAGVLLGYKGPDTGGEKMIVPAEVLVPKPPSTPTPEPPPLLPVPATCPEDCQHPRCFHGDFASGGMLMDDGKCTTTCSSPDEQGKRYCGRGAAFESSADSIDCSACIDPEASCGSCVLWGDPHIVPFDREVRMWNGRGANVGFYNYGDYWIVNSNDVKIQGRYYSSKWAGGQAMMRGLIVTGPFVDDHVLLIEPLYGQVKYNKRTLCEDFPSTFVAYGKVYLKCHNGAEIVRTGGRHPSINSVEVQLPLGVRLTVNRFRAHLDAIITMHQVPGGLDGHCGNCNGDETDDTQALIRKRHSEPIDPDENRFETKEYRFMGCYKERRYDRLLPQFRDKNMNQQECSMACLKNRWFSITNNRECYCGAKDYTKYGEASGCNCEGSGPNTHEKMCVYGYFDSVQPKELTLDDCKKSLRKKADKICTAAFVNESAEVMQEMITLCTQDICFGGKDFADDDAWAGHTVLPCATLADVQDACGKRHNNCSESNGNCDMSSCAAYMQLGWFDSEIKLLADGRAQWNGLVTNDVRFEDRSGICVTSQGVLEPCAATSCMRQPEVITVPPTTTTTSTTILASTTTTTTTPCVSKDCTFWGDPHIHSFDNMHFSDSNTGDMWLVRAGSVSIQGRFGKANHFKRSFLKGVAVGGTFLNGNTLTFGTLSESIHWNRDEILTHLGSHFNATFRGRHVKAAFRRGIRSIKFPHGNVTVQGIHVELPEGITLVINRFKTWLGLRISMEHAVEGQDGICGNFNGKSADDGLAAVGSRMQLKVPEEDSLFHTPYSDSREGSATLLDATYAELMHVEGLLRAADAFSEEALSTLQLSLSSGD